MHLFVLFIGLTLLPEVYCLECYNCVDELGVCPTIQCPQNHQCAAMRMVSYAGGMKVVDTSIKGCAVPEHCVQASVNFGLSKTATNTKCCTTSRCNDQAAPVPGNSGPNGKKCFYCNGNDCTSTVNCEGNEDHCITAKVDTAGTSMTVKGCASKMICSALDMPAIAQAVGSEMECCQGDFCNSASSTCVSLLLLVVPVLSLLFLS